MLNEKITVAICGKSYRLITDNIRQLMEDAAAVEKCIKEFCSTDDFREKADGAVLTALNYAGEISEYKAKLAQAQERVAELEKGEADAKTALAEHSALKMESAELAELKKKYAKLEESIAQLTGTLKVTEAKAAECESAKNDLEISLKLSEELEEKNARLAAALKDSAEMLDKQQKRAAELERQIDELKTQAVQVTAMKEENEQLNKKIKEAEKSAAEGSPKQLDELKAQNSELAKQVEELKKQDSSAKVKELSEKLAVSEGALTQLKEENSLLEESAKKYDELMVSYSQMESENAALKAGSEAAQDNEDTIAELRKQIDEITAKNEKLSNEVHTLQKTNSSLEKQINEILEDGQLTL